MIQEVIIALAFITASFFIFKKIYDEFTAKDGCSAGCSSCDVSKSNNNN